ncbi:MAG: hypothetical protein HGA36_00020 [Candidatus Moranbacteria bacterium]|nr:hypothetical protein [Candidatus Moranbacteria bacterium]
MKGNYIKIRILCQLLIFVAGFFVVDSSTVAKADNALAVSCICKKSVDSLEHTATKFFASEANCDQNCADTYGANAVYALGLGGGTYKPVTKTAGGSATIVRSCTCSSGAIYENAITGPFIVTDEGGCITQCRSSSSKIYQYDVDPTWKDVPIEGQVQPSTKQFNYRLLGSFPGFFQADQIMNDFPGLIIAIYKFGIWTVGIAGLFMLVVGGFMYMASAGNTSTAGNARGIIWDSLLGIVAALGAYLILYVINPDLTKINLSFTAVEIKYDQIDASNPNSSRACQDCVSVVDICKENPCSLNKVLAGKLRTALVGKNARITEGWPATVNHSSSCHGNGTCADVNLTENKGNVQEVKKLYDAMKAAGLKPIYEDTALNCVKYTAVDVYCHPYATMTYPSFHVSM